MNYVLYTSPDCESCRKVARELRSLKISFREVDIFAKEHIKPKGLMVVPALFRREILLAYGPDIVSMLKEK